MIKVEDKSRKVIIIIFIIVTTILILWHIFLQLRQTYLDRGFAEGRETIYNSILSDLDKRGYSFITNNTETVKIGRVPD